MATTAEQLESALPDEQGHFGPYGGMFVAETLMQPLEELRQAYERYLGDKDFLAELDWSVGEVLDALDEAELADDTLVLFTSDNGTNRDITSRVGEREVRGGKGLTTDAGTHVPLIVSWPGVVATPTWGRSPWRISSPPGWCTTSIILPKSPASWPNRTKTPSPPEKTTSTSWVSD